MKARWLWIGGIVALVLALSSLGFAANAQEPDPKEEAIVKGLAWLASAQWLPEEGGDGGWSPGACDRVSYTGLAVLKLETRAIELGLDPLGSEYEYAANVQAGLDFIMAASHTMPIGMQPAGNPDSDGDGIGVYWDNWPDCGGGHVTYNTSIALMALSASKHPELYGDIAQDALDFTAWGQVDEGCEPHRGGWRYMDNSCDSDNSNTGWVTLALGYAQAAPPHGFGLSIPPFVLTELSPWLDMIQDDVNGDDWDGGSFYDPWNPWVNILKTGNLVYEFGLVGDSKASQRLLDAVDYIERHWFDNTDPGWGWPNNPADYQAMFTTMKGLEAMGIDKLDLDGDTVPEYDWFADFVNVLVSQQASDGSWPWCNWGNDVACTSWALLTLEKAVPSLAVDVSLDIKPGSCPNPFNLKDKGVLPVAIAGTAEFDVTQIDPATIKLYWTDADLAISPLRWALEDVATPFEPFRNKPIDAYACHTLGADGIMDLSMKFSSPSLASILPGVTKGDVIVLVLTGNLKEEFGGKPIIGEDVVRINFVTK
jgi:hypothetical protein